MWLDAMFLTAFLVLAGIFVVFLLEGEDKGPEDTRGARTLG